jgi:hypothetical protein
MEMKRDFLHPVTFVETHHTFQKERSLVERQTPLALALCTAPITGANIDGDVTWGSCILMGI